MAFKAIKWKVITKAGSVHRGETNTEAWNVKPSSINRLVRRAWIRKEGWGKTTNEKEENQESVTTWRHVTKVCEAGRRDQLHQPFLDGPERWGLRATTGELTKEGVCRFQYHNRHVFVCCWGGAQMGEGHVGSCCQLVPDSLGSV